MNNVCSILNEEVYDSSFFLICQNYLDQGLKMFGNQFIIDYHYQLVRFLLFIDINKAFFLLIISSI